MKARLILTCVALSAFFVMSCGPATVQVPGPPPRVNIVWISVEDLSPRLGCYGDPVARTPNLDRLASEGARFTNAFSTAGVCAPSRSAIITGMYQTSIGTHHMRTSHPAPGLPTPYSAVPPPYVKAFTESLRAAGYYCTNNVKTDYQFAPAADPRQPLTAWDESSRTAHWRNRKPGQPFFAVFNFTITHESQVWPKEGKPLQTDPSRLQVPPYYPDTPAVREDLARHYDNIAQMDEQIGRVLKELEEDNLTASTAVFFWSDHGDGLPRAKRWLYDSGLKVPLIVRWPGHVGPASAVDRLVSLVDLGPTVLSLAGVRIPAHMQGKAFLGPLAEHPRGYIFGARDRIDESYDMVRAVRGPRFKYIRNYYPNDPYVLWVPYRNRGIIMKELLRLEADGELRGPAHRWLQATRPPEELYDTSLDPQEISNLAGNSAFAPVLEEMRAVLDDWMAEIQDLGRISESQMVASMWPGGVQPVTSPPVFITDQLPGHLTLYCSTQGASLAFTLDTGERAEWQLYTGPIPIPEKGVTVRARAIRYGYKESAEASFTAGGD